jgi:DNA mismatch repair protein MutS
MYIENFEPIIVTNERKNFIRHGRNQESIQFNRELFLKLCPLKVIDKESLRLIQILQLHKAIDHTRTATGSAVLLRSLTQPSSNLHYIQSRQESLREIASDDKLRLALKDLVQEYRNGENALYKFFNKGLYALFPYPDIKKARESAVNITNILKTIPETESPYLRALMSNFQSYKGSSIDRMMNGRIYKTINGLKSDQEVGFFTPKLKFTPHRFTEWILAGPAMALAPFIYDKIGFSLPLSPLMSTTGLVWTGIYTFYSVLFKPLKDTERFIEPLRAACIHNSLFSRVVDTVGMIDELLSFHDFADEFAHAATIPRVTDQDRHFFEATALKSPVLAKNRADCVPNNVSINRIRLTFISGPNSGGKTTLCKGIVHNQLLAQIGSYVLAQKASINIADRISYQAPEFDGLQDAEGRFGTELARTRDIFYSTGPKSLVIFDELAEGTTYEERLKESFEILSDFYTIGNNTVLVTHNHSLADRFMEEKKGQCLMAEFDGENPTYRIIPGISRVSHAGRIAEKINFSKKDRRRYMEEKGYMTQVSVFRDPILPSGIKADT